MTLHLSLLLQGLGGFLPPKCCLHWGSSGYLDKHTVDVQDASGCVCKGDSRDLPRPRYLSDSPERT